MMMRHALGAHAIYIRLDARDRANLPALMHALETHRGDVAVYLHVNDGLAVRRIESRRLRVDLSNGLSDEVRKLVRQEVWVE